MAKVAINKKLTGGRNPKGRKGSAGVEKHMKNISSSVGVEHNMRTLAGRAKRSDSNNFRRKFAGSGGVASADD